METRQWNVVSALVVVLTLMVAFTAITCLMRGLIDFDAFQKAIGVVLLPMMGYMGRMLSEGKS